MSPKPPLISIITPVFNGADYIDLLIQSVLNQGFTDWEHIVIDDGSNDNGATTAVLKRYSHLRWWSRENKGQYATMNEGLRTARGKWVCFISADDLMAPGALLAVAEYAHKAQKCEVIYGKTLFIREDGSKHAVQNLFQRVPPKCFVYLMGIYHCSMYVEKTVVIDRGLFFDERLKFSGDFDWIVRLIHSGLDFGFTKKTLASLRTHSDRASIVHKVAQDQELNRLMKQYRVNLTLFSLVNFISYLRSAFIETITMLRCGQFKMLWARIRHWVDHRVRRRL